MKPKTTEALVNSFFKKDITTGILAESLLKYDLPTSEMKMRLERRSMIELQFYKATGNLALLGILLEEEKYPYVKVYKTAVGENIYAKSSEILFALNNQKEMFDRYKE